MLYSIVKFCAIVQSEVMCATHFHRNFTREWAHIVENPTRKNKSGFLAEMEGFDLHFCVAKIMVATSF